MNLNIIILFPFLTALCVLLVHRTKPVRWVTLTGSVAQLILMILLALIFHDERIQGNTASFLFEVRYSWFPSLGISYHVGIDGVSLAMMLLTSFIVLAGVLVSWNIEKYNAEYYFLLMLLSLGAYGFFISMDLLVMFFFLEVAVIPKFLLIGMWGSGKKEASANKLALMLMLGSALILLGMMMIYVNGGSTFDMPELANAQFSAHLQSIIFPFLFIGFGVFTAMFPFHTWVPDGHSSAPTAGSMFLAGISMKLGGFGCLRVAMYLMPKGAQQYGSIIIVLAAIGIIYGAFATMMQKDLKYMNAYSSISHCGFVLLGLGMLTKTAVTGAVMQMVSHGLMTALFFAVIGMLYERSHTRQINEMSGMQKSIPFIISLLYLSGLCSLGLPGLSGFVAEMTVFIGSWEQPNMLHRIATVFAAMSIVVTAVYILKAVTAIAMGPEKETTHTFSDARWNEKLAALVLIAGILFIGLAPQWLNELIKPGAADIISRITGK